MIEAISSALSGMRGSIAQLGTAASNIANVNTTGFQSRRADLQSGPGGSGVVVASTSLNGGQGPFLTTSQPLDVSIEGDSFFEVQTAEGGSRFTRNGSFRLDGEGYLVTAGGDRVAGDIQVPADATKVSITRSGEVVGMVGGEEVTFGNLPSVRFNNPTGLESVGNGLYAESENSGVPIRGSFSRPGFGQLAPGTLEGSDTDLGGEIVNTILAQRAFQAQIVTIQAADEMLEETVNLGRSRRR
jgi:flagellar basal-body rod protein FlgG